MIVPLVNRIILAGWIVCRRRYPAFLLTGLPAAGLLMLTVFSEYSISTSGVMGWMEGSNIAALFWYLLYLLRIFAYAMALCGWSWLAGASLFEETPSIGEAIVQGTSSAFRCMLAVFPVWMLTVLMGFFIVGICRFLWMAYSGINIASGILAVSVAASIAMPFMVLLTGKFMFVIPVASFERVASIDALARAAGCVKWRSFLWSGSVLGSISTLVIVSIIVPSWCFFNSLWGMLQPLQILVRQTCSIVFTCVAAPAAVILITALYFTFDLLRESETDTA